LNARKGNQLNMNLTAITGDGSGRISARDAALAARYIAEGRTVVFPTETVYGLGANAWNRKAVERIFEIKGRPPDNPLIVHIAEEDMLPLLAEHISVTALKLMKNFWPGPLTLLFKKRAEVPDTVTASLPTVCVRMPANEIALEIIGRADVPVAAPSANISGRPSITTFRHARAELEGLADMIIDGGDCIIGLESTVLQLDPQPLILRPGAISREEIERVIGTHVSYYAHVKGASPSPGVKYRHYAPSRATLLVASEEDLEDYRRRLEEGGYRVGIIAMKETEVNGRVIRAGRKERYEEMAHNLFSSIRELDDGSVDFILVESVHDKGVGAAIMNRLRKASGNTDAKEVIARAVRNNQKNSSVPRG